MKGVHLRFYTVENRRIRHWLIHDWLLINAKRMGIPGGSAFRAEAGYGRHGGVHEGRFRELSGEVPILVEFVMTNEQADAYLASIEKEGLELFYARLPTEFGVTGKPNDLASIEAALGDVT